MSGALAFGLEPLALNLSSMNIIINGYEIVAEEGITILEAAKRADIHIPTLCHVNKATSDIPCGICVVSVEGVEEPVRSCVTPVREGMRITTDSKELQVKRNERMTLLMETHFGDCKAPCNLTCPGQINVQGYIAHVAKGQHEEALRLVMERNPFPFPWAGYAPGSAKPVAAGFWWMSRCPSTISSVLSPTGAWRIRSTCASPATLPPARRSPLSAAGLPA